MREHRTIWTWTCITYERWIILRHFSVSIHTTDFHGGSHHEPHPLRAKLLEDVKNKQKQTPIIIKEIEKSSPLEKWRWGRYRLLKRVDGPYSSCSYEGLPVSVWNTRHPVTTIKWSIIPRSIPSLRICRVETSQTRFQCIILKQNLSNKFTQGCTLWCMSQGLLKKKNIKKRYGDTYLEWNIAKHLVSNSYFLHRDSTTALHLSWNRLQKPFWLDKPMH